MSLRAAPRNLMNLSKAVYNVFFMRHFDNCMRKWKGQEWIEFKNEQAIKRTNSRLNINP